MPPIRRHRAPIAATLLVLLALAIVLLALGGCAGSDSTRSPRAGAHARPGTSGAASADPSTGAGTSSAAVPTLLPTPPPAGTPVTVHLAPRPVGAPVPADFLGLSFELRSLPLLAGYARATGTPAASAHSARDDLVTLLRSLGPGVLRLGGASADEQVAWVPGAAAAGRSELPRWATIAIDAHDLAGIARLAREAGWHVLLAVNLGHYDPTAAAREAAAAHAALGSALAGIEIGNEPDRFARKHLRGAGWDFAAYRRQAAAYRAAIAAAAPGVPIAGPDASSGAPGLAWVRATARTLRPALLTDHYYPLSSCGYRPTVGELLGLGLRRAQSAVLAAQAALARTAATPLRVDEVNDISCEGLPGVSDTFASALWALDYATQAMRAGLAGVNFHDLLAKPGSYSPLLAPAPAALAAGALRPQPEWYALLAARELPGSTPLPTRVSAAGGRSSLAEDLSASAFRAPDGRVRLVLVDYDPPGSRPLAVHLDLARAGTPARAHTRAHSPPTNINTPAYTAGSVLRLTAPSPAATAGVRLGGRAVARDGAWSAPAALPAVYEEAGALSVQIDPSSAAIVTLYPR
jgi:hypothetical protein